MNENESMETEKHERFMRQCIRLAQIAHSRNNTPVGSIVVIDDEVVGEGIEDLPAGTRVTGHAETLACQMAVDRIGPALLDGATLYTTAEPCFMCSYVIRQYRIGFVVYGRETPVIGGITSSLPILTDPNLTGWRPAPRVLGGILQSECHLFGSLPRST